MIISILKPVQINFIFQDIVKIMCLYCNVMYEKSC